MGIDKLMHNLTWNKKMELLRRANNWTQEDAAKRCNTNQKMYWNWEKGRNYPRKKSQAFIANAFKAKVEDIFPV